MGGRSIRGDINQILNRMVREGTIAHYRTNLSNRAPDEEIVVTVTASETEELGTVEQKVRKALEGLPVSIVVRADLP